MCKEGLTTIAILFTFILQHSKSDQSTNIALLMQDFNLYREAKEHYKLLVPEKADGLILLALYEKFENNEFGEDKIIDTIEKVSRDLGEPHKRTEYEKNNKIILRLQEFFLWRDELKKVYRFKRYGEDFCKRVRKRLSDSYNPDKIKRIFDYLYNELEKSISTEGRNFNQWVEDHFNARNNELAEQIEVLDQQVGETVKDFQRKIKEEDIGIIQLLQDIEMSLDLIKAQANKLIDAFKVTYLIDDILIEILESPNAAPYIANIQQVRTFNDQVRSHLEQVSKRIDKIKPRLREFIYEFNQRDFDRKTGMFVSYLIKNSSYTKSEKGKWILSLPHDVPLAIIRNKESTPIFSVIPLREIGPRAPAELPKRIINEEKQRALVLKTQKKLFEKARISYWFKLALHKIKEEGELDFSPFFYQILSEEKGYLLIAVKTAHKVLRYSAKNVTLKVEILKEEAISIAFPKTTIWKMNIKKK